MIDQYIYTRVDGTGNRKDFGHGLAEKTAGIPAALEKEISTIARYKNTTTDSQGNRVKILEKRNLGTTRFAALQQSVRFPERSSALDLEDGDPRLLYVSSTNRAQFLSHGLVCDIYDDTGIMLHPDKWFSQDFVDYNVNLKQANLQELPGLKENPLPLEPLEAVLGKAGLSLDNFVTAVRASFDAENWDTIVLIELDFTRPDAYALGEQLLRWVYHFLPFSMRRFADFSSCYDLSCGGYDFALALIPTAMLQQERGGRVTFQGIPNSAKYGYLLTGDRCTHQKLSGRPDFDSSGSLYAQWVEQVIRLVYQQEHLEGLATLGRLFSIYEAFDRYLTSEEKSRQCRTELYDALIWVYLQNGIAEVPHIAIADQAVCVPENASTRYYEELMALQNTELIRPQIPILLEKASAEAARGGDVTWLNLLCALRDKVGNSDAIQAVLDQFLARILETTPMPTIRQTVDAFFHTIAVEQESEKSALLERAFFPVTKESPAASTERGMRRAKTWLESFVTERDTLQGYLEQIQHLFQTLSGFSPKHIQFFLQHDLIPKIRLTDADFQDLANLLQTRLRFQRSFEANSTLSEPIKDFFDTIQDTVLGFCDRHIERLHQKPSDLTDLFHQIFAALPPTADFEEGRDYAKEFFQRCLDAWGEAVPSKQILCAKPKDSEDVWTPPLKNDPNLHKSVAEAIKNASLAGVDIKSLTTLYLVVCWFMTEGAYSYKTRDWYLEYAEIFNGIATDPVPFENSSALRCCAVSQYLHEKKLDYPSFQPFVQQYMECCGAGCGTSPQQNTLLQRAAYSLLKPVLELFDQNELPTLEAEMLTYYSVLEARFRKESPSAKKNTYFYLSSEDTDPQKDSLPKHPKYQREPNAAMSVAFTRILKHQGCRKLIRLLDRYPSAPSAQDLGAVAPEAETRAGSERWLPAIQKILKRKPSAEEEYYYPREGAYPWMVTNEMLFEALSVTIQNHTEWMIQEMQQDEMLCPDFVTAVFSLAPTNSTLHDESRSVNTELYRLWEASQAAGSASKKAMSELAKKQAFWLQKGMRR